MNTYGHFPLVAKEGKGATLTDCDGKEYIDFGSGIGVNALGYSDNGWVEAVCEQVKTLNHVSNYFYTVPATSLAKTLTKSAGMSRVFFSNSGAEANEGAIKLARKYSFNKYGGNRNKILTLNDSFHGRTIATLEATGQDVFHNYFFPFTGGFVYAMPTIDSVKDALRDDICAIMIEVIQGEGGVNPLGKDFVAYLKNLCDEKDILLIIDEVQTGIGRTGKEFAFMHFDIQPDIVTVAKGLGGGLPIGGFMCNKKLENVMGPSSHGSTFGGNPIACAGANYVLKTVFDPEFLAEVTKKADYIKGEILALKSPKVKGIKGIGLMMGIELDGEINKDLCAKMLSEGLLTLTAGGNVLRLLPPLSISQSELEKGLEILRRNLI